MDLVTFLITTYNSERWIEECLHSIINQTHENLQILLIDDGSADKTVDIITQISDKRIELYRKDHSGISKSQNFGIDRVRGDLIAKLGSDDICHEQRIEKQLKFIKQNKSYGIIGTNYILVDEQSGKRLKIKNPERDKLIKEQLPRRCCVWDGSVLMKKDLVIQLNGYDERRVTGEDWDFFLRAIEFTKFFNIQEYLTFKRFHSSNISASSSALMESKDILLSYNNSIIEKSNDKTKIGKAYFNIGNYFYYENDFNKATECFSTTLYTGGLTIQYLRYFFFSKYLYVFVRFYRKYKLYKLFGWLRYFDKSNKYFRGKY